MSDYYEILSEQQEGYEGRWTIHLCEQADVYRGHFPGQPIAPGACNIELIRQLASRLTGTECRFSEITQCRFSHLITPAVENPLSVNIRIDSTKLTATISWHDTPCITFKGEISQ